MRKLKLTPFLLLAGLFLIFTGCEEHYEEEEIVIGKWDLISTQSGDDFYELESPFTWEFRADGTYLVTNETGKFEDAPFESSPFRGEGTYEGQWNMSLSSLLEMRETYRAVLQLWVDEITEDKMKFHFDPVDVEDEDDVYIVLEPAV